MPARSAFLIPSVPIACAATRRPWRWASEIADSSSSGSSWAFPGTAPLVSTPPVAITLMQSAPSNICSRTALRASYGLSTIRPANQPCPPVMQITLPAARMRGPGMRPAAIASRTSIATLPVQPTSRTDVTPACSVLRAFSTAWSTRWFGVSERTAFIVSVSPVISKCTCALTSPGVTHSAARSNWPPSAALRISRIVAPSTTTSTFRRGSSSDPS